MNNWIAYELHTHTNHSDGKHTFQELASSAKDIGLGGFAMTDHNTIATFKYMQDESNRLNIDILKGLEWTTFWGHILLIGINEFLEWTDVTLDNINEKLLDIRSKSELIGVAHPFRLGGIIATGCYFEYEINNWDIFDYIEVWSGIMPDSKYMNKRAFDFWTDLLNRGHRISGVSGRDWHKSTENDRYIPATYLNIKEGNAISAIKEGRITVGFGYIVDFKVIYEHCEYDIGSVIKKNIKEVAQISANIFKTSLNDNGNIDKQKLKLTINSNLGILFNNINIEESTIISIKDINKLSWLRAELYEDKRMISFTNPIYFD
ncbi:CehA/McbA family metallohydrolase [Clostridium sp. AL.422]|uniref:CehA/McbA family metallohydrolase n=1 Tax=Clostridium TaxID=1485 RepID=UPI00293DA6E4|nr:MULTISPECIES: CehA/McbA family metallohydrolase [unclassified Clostridium]MDV4152046.1 CehA/McbA family metallohydrolase [Clostridium sp. AL.422]